MTKEEALVRSIVGPVRSEVRVYACAIEVTGRLLFLENMALDEIRVTRHVYPEVAAKMGKSLQAVSRQLERIGNLCWDCIGEEGQKKYIGRKIKDIRAPRDMLFYLAYYCHFRAPYFEILTKGPEPADCETKNKI